MRHLQHLARVLALVLFCATLAGSARDARADTAAAQALFDAAKQLMTQGKYAEACPKLEESQRLDPGIGTQFNLATCYEQVGRTASAWSTFLEVAAAAKAAGQPDREKVARQRATALEANLMRLTITAPADAPADMQVKRDGAPVGKAQLGIAVPVDPGKHTVEASAPFRSPFTTTIEITKPGASQTVAIPQLKALPQGSTPPPYAPYGPAQPQANPYALPPAPAPLPAMRRRSTGMMVGGIVLVSLGALVGLTGALVTAVCSSGTCTGDTYYDADSGEWITENGESNVENAGYGLLIAGVLGVGGGIPLIIIGSKKVPVEPEAKKASAVPELLVGPRFTGLRWSM